MHPTLLKFVLCSIKCRARYVWSMQSQFRGWRIHSFRLATLGEWSE